MFMDTFKTQGKVKNLKNAGKKDRKSFRSWLWVTKLNYTNMALISKKTGERMRFLCIEAARTSGFVCVCPKFV